MNPEVLKAQVRSFLIFAAGIFGGVGVSRHWFTSEQLTGFINSETVISAIVAIIGFIWSGIVHTQSNAVAVVAALKNDPESPVKGVVVEQTIAGRELATAVLNSNPKAGIAPAGTDAASRLAQPHQP